MKLTDLTDSNKISKFVLPSMLMPRDSHLLAGVQKELNARIEKGELPGHENGAAFIAAVRDAIINIPELPTKPSESDALNLSVQLINTTFEYERIARANAQLGV